jgi:16S rRNA G966 N2-methylase RsmD
MDQETKAFDITRESCMDEEFGIETEEPYGIENTVGWYKDASRYEPTKYRMLQEIFDYVNPKQDDIFLDLGSGKGRVVFFVSVRKLRRVVGVELRKELFDAAKRNSAAFTFNKTPIEFINDDVVNYRIKDESLFFLFHPFGEKTFAKVIDNIKDSLNENPRQIRIIYCNPVYQKFLNDREWLILEKNLKEADCMIWQNRFLEKKGQ